MNKAVFVYVDINDHPVLVGSLFCRIRGGRESASFEYDKDWLNYAGSFSLEPALSLGTGPYHTAADKALFGALGDSAPDRWGRVLMRRAEKMRATHDKQTPRTLMEIDYLLMVDDETRQGALRFATHKGGPFLAHATDSRIPPFIELPRLLSATQKVIDDHESEDDLKLLLAPGSSLGGARPKASVRDKNGELAIAKFPSAHDEMTVVLWEAVALSLAQKAHINTADFRVESIAGLPVLVLTRFDRNNGQRIPFLSAMSMLNANDRESHSYLEIVDALKQHGSLANHDIKELWRRIVFSILISNTDDHLRNHGFLYSKGGWRLAPAYDLNPVPHEIKRPILSTTIDFDDGTASVEMAMSVIDYFGLSLTEAKSIVSELNHVVLGWRSEAKRLGISAAETDKMASAFSAAS